jgi:hypothetical protein
MSKKTDKTPLSKRSVPLTTIASVVISLLIGIGIGAAIERNANVPVHVIAPGPWGQTQFHYWMDIHQADGVTTGQNV